MCICIVSTSFPYIINKVNFDVISFALWLLTMAFMKIGVYISITSNVENGFDS